MKKETLDASLPTIVGSPVIIQHKDVTEENADKLRCGVIANAYFNEADGWYYVDGIIWDDKAQELINKGWSVSCSYDFLAFNDEGGEENNIHYDKEFTQLNFTHLAIVDNPRYERANIIFNSKIDNENDKHESAGSPEGGQFANKDDYSLYFNPNTTGLQYWDDLLKSETTAIIEMSPDNYIDAVTEGYNKEQDKYSDKPLYWEKSDFIKSRTDKRLEQLRENFGKIPYDMPFLVYETHKDGFINLSSQEGIHRSILAKEIGLNKMPVAIFMNRRYNDNIEDNILKENLKIITKNYKSINNSKEQEMNLIDKLQELINSVKNEKGDDMDEKDKKDIENEKVDKRKLIDEVGGILKGKVDDEVIRTIMKKMEEASYDASEDDKADNKKVKNEAEADKKDEKEDDKKEDKKVDNEEDKKEVDELKKDVKEDIDNKCKNSKEESSFDKINAIYNSVKQVTESSSYVSRQEKLDNAVEYFK